jgi:hypothetical protein
MTPDSQIGKKKKEKKMKILIKSIKNTEKMIFKMTPDSQIEKKRKKKDQNLT